MDKDELAQWLAEFMDSVLSTLGYAWDVSRPHLHDGAQWLADLLAG